MKTQIERSILGKFRKRTSIINEPTAIVSQIEKHSHMDDLIKAAIIVYPADAKGETVIDDQQFTWDHEHSAWHASPSLADLRRIVTPDQPYVHGLINRTTVTVIPD